MAVNPFSQRDVQRPLNHIQHSLMKRERWIKWYLSNGLENWLNRVWMENWRRGYYLWTFWMMMSLFFHFLMLPFPPEVRLVHCSVHDIFINKKHHPLSNIKTLRASFRPTVNINHSFISISACCWLTNVSSSSLAAQHVMHNSNSPHSKVEFSALSIAPTQSIC